MDEAEALRDVASLLKAISNRRRLAVLYHLADGEKSVGEMERLVGLSQSALSQHLARLRQIGVVATRREAQRVFYSIADPRVTTLLGALVQICGVAALGEIVSPDLLGRIDDNSSAEES